MNEGEQGASFERLMNFISDADHGWWPFLFMRPEPDERMTTVRVAALAVLYGLLPAVFVNAVVRVTGENADSLHPLLFPLGAVLAFFAVFRFTFAACWNRRAERLKRRS
jgi:hypothetical protein